MPSLQITQSEVLQATLWHLLRYRLPSTWSLRTPHRIVAIALCPPLLRNSLILCSVYTIVRCVVTIFGCCNNVFIMSPTIVVTGCCVFNCCVASCDS